MLQPGQTVPIEQQPPLCVAYAFPALALSAPSLPEAFTQFHGVTTQEFTSTCRKVDAYWAREEFKNRMLTIAMVVSFGLIPVMVFAIWMSLDELFWKKTRQRELRGKIQEVLDQDNASIYLPKGCHIVFDVDLGINSFGVPTQRYEMKIISLRMQLPTNQGTAPTVKLYETRNTEAEYCNMFNPIMPQSLSQYGLTQDEWKNTIDQLNKPFTEIIDRKFLFIYDPLYWSFLVTAPLLCLPWLLIAPFLLTYMLIIYYAKLKEEATNAREKIVPGIINEQNQSVYSKKGLRLHLTKEKFGTNALNYREVYYLQVHV